MRKTKVAERVRGAVRWPMGFDVVRVACVPAVRTLGFGRRVDGGIVIVREEETAVVKRRRKEDIEDNEKCIFKCSSLNWTE